MVLATDLLLSYYAAVRKRDEDMNCACSATKQRRSVYRKYDSILLGDGGTLSISALL